MNRPIVAIPLLAAIWFAAPARASAQDPQPEPRVAQPRTAVPRPERPERGTEPRVVTAPVGAAAPAPPAAGADDQRGRSGGGRGAGGNNGRGNSGNNGRDNGRDNGRGSPRVAVARPPNVPIYSSNYYNRPRYYPPAYYHNWARHTYRWSPIAYAPWSLIYGSVGFANFGFSFGGNYGYGYGAYGYPPYGYGSYGYGPYGYGPYGYGQAGPYGGSTTFDTGSVRLRIRPRDAQVFVDGYFAGYVDDFDGTFQSLRLEQGGHKLEVRMPGYETLQLDVHVQPNRTITLREDLIPRP